MRKSFNLGCPNFLIIKKNMRSVIPVWSLVVTTTMATSCATIASGGDPFITINGSLVDEPVTITTEKQTYPNIILPAEVQVKRKKLEGQKIKIESDSYTFNDIELHKAVNHWVVGDFLLGGVAGLGIDLLTNSVSKPTQSVYDIVPMPKKEKTNGSTKEYSLPKPSAQTCKLPTNVIKVSGGLSFVVSNVYLEDQFENKIRKITWRPGVSALLEYEHIFKSGWGLGLNTIYNDTRYPNGIKSITKKKMALRQFYIGPSIVRRSIIGDRWFVEGALGMGYAYTDGDFTDGTSGVGFMLKGGVEYLLSKHVGIGAELNDVIVITGFEDEYLKKAFPNDYSGMNGTFRLDLALGLRFYF